MEYNTVRILGFIELVWCMLATNTSRLNEKFRMWSQILFRMFGGILYFLNYLSWEVKFFEMPSIGLWSRY